MFPLVGPYSSHRLLYRRVASCRSGEQATAVCGRTQYYFQYARKESELSRVRWSQRCPTINIMVLKQRFPADRLCGLSVNNRKQSPICVIDFKSLVTS